MRALWLVLGCLVGCSGSVNEPDAPLPPPDYVIVSMCNDDGTIRVALESTGQQADMVTLEVKDATGAFIATGSSEVTGPKVTVTFTLPARGLSDSSLVTRTWKGNSHVDRVRSFTPPSNCG
jgi:hypothetical protein